MRRLAVGTVAAGALIAMASPAVAADGQWSVKITTNKTEVLNQPYRYPAPIDIQVKCPAGQMAEAHFYPEMAMGNPTRRFTCSGKNQYLTWYVASGAFFRGGTIPVRVTLGESYDSIRDQDTRQVKAVLGTETSYVP
jgi:hypothetical protein